MNLVLDLVKWDAYWQVECRVSEQVCVKVWKQAQDQVLVQVNGPVTGQVLVHLWSQVRISISEYASEDLKKESQ